MRFHWFLPETPDVIGTLLTQADVTVSGLAAFVSWSEGDPEQASEVRAAEHEADRVRRTLQRQLRQAFSTPMDQEDLFSLSELLDSVMNEAKNTVREADVLGIEPDEPVHTMAESLAEAMGHVRRAFDHLTNDGTTATSAADSAVSAARNMQKTYRKAMRDLLASEDLREVVARRELYGRVLEAGDCVVAVAERVWYAVVKEG